MEFIYCRRLNSPLKAGRPRYGASPQLWGCSYATDNNLLISLGASEQLPMHTNVLTVHGYWYVN